jgi:hypothetical protein
MVERIERNRGEYPQSERERKPYRSRKQTGGRSVACIEVRERLLVFVDHCGVAIPIGHASAVRGMISSKSKR